MTSQVVMLMSLRALPASLAPPVRGLSPVMEGKVPLPPAWPPGEDRGLGNGAVGGGGRLASVLYQDTCISRVEEEGGGEGSAGYPSQGQPLEGPGPFSGLTAKLGCCLCFFPCSPETSSEGEGTVEAWAGCELHGLLRQFS